MLGASNSPTKVLALGFDCTEQEMGRFVNLVGGTPSSLSFLSRPRSDTELNDLAKTYKLSQTELDQMHELLEQSIVNRIATKHFVN